MYSNNFLNSLIIYEFIIQFFFRFSIYKILLFVNYNPYSIISFSYLVVLASSSSVMPNRKAEGQGT